MNVSLAISWRVVRYLYLLFFLVLVIVWVRVDTDCNV